MKSQKSIRDANPPDVATNCEVLSENKRIDSHQLFGRQNLIVIVHHGEEYRLRITSNDKLILTK